MQNNKLKIGLIGYGKMGKTIEKLALKRGHEIIMRISSSNVLEMNINQLDSVDVAIEFTTPESAPNNLRILAQHGVSTVCGSTAWLDYYKEICQLYKDNNTSFLYASNFSVGVNITFAVNEFLASIMNGFPSYNVSMLESHHLEKKDAPSGTAVTLAEQIINNLDYLDKWHNSSSKEKNSLPIESIREVDIKGLHTVKYTSEIDEITLKHEAFSREGFALGAIMAAEFINGKKDIYKMSDVISLKKHQ
ncbi:MAG: 4-hydroxy-tetrahydrodipicolinate reductase [Saprospiraceae bacterium]|nr:4-hydroxy-tetrahydrodipicolinate reductase [Bacteroidia bacterium]NNE16119.1 4-hydroxy-tetrahydrodipicolinate reductase [Saprospiraceae bacterium]NNL91409.1 4-hydroxy-tetrahydrodipicolinate reductase [Saprospiraceae bacterium]